MPKRASAKRNVLLAVLIVVLAGALIVLVPRLRSNEPLLPPESEEIQAKRLAPENAYKVLIEACTLAPEKPAPLAPAADAPPQPRNAQGFERGSLGELVQVYRSDDDPGMVHYVLSCDPLVAKVREALARPYFLLPIRWDKMATLSTQERDAFFGTGQFTQLGAILTARSVVAARHEEGRNALALLLDAFRLAVLLQGDGDTPIATDAIVSQALPRWFEAAHASSEPDLRAALDALKAIFDAAAPMTANLEFGERMIDQSTAPAGWMRIPDRSGPRRRGENDEHNEDEKFARKLFFTTHLRRAHRFISENRAILTETVQMSYPDYAVWKTSHGSVFASSSHAWPCDPMAWVNRMVSMHARLDTAYAGARIMTALELYRIAHGGYPDSLDALAPDLLPSVPSDPFSGKAFHYRHADQDYILASTGPNQQDDTATERQRSDDIVLHEPKEAES